MSNIIDLFKSSGKSKDKGRKAIFMTLLRPHIPLLYRKALHWTGTPEDADDLLQNVLIKLTGKIDAMREVDNLAPWLVKVLYRQFVDGYRRQERSPLVNESTLTNTNAHGEFQGSVIDMTPDNRDDIANLEINAELTLALNSLNTEMRQTFILLEYRGYTVEETARMLNEQPGTIKSRNHRARKQLKKFLSAGTFSPSAS